MQGRFIIVVLPVSREYIDAFLDDRTVAAFEKALDEAIVIALIAPEATLVRLDRVPGISDHGYFSDFVHMNSFGRRVATPMLLRAVNKAAPQLSLEPPSSASLIPDK